jgi:hypothetical protein
MRLEVVYFGKGKTPYLTIKGLPSNNCVVCLENKITTSHHIIPKRAKPKDRLMANLRVRICKSCDKIIHAENGELDGFDIIKKQGKMINNLKNDLKEVKKKDYDWIIKEISERRIVHIKNIPLIAKNLKKENNVKEIYPAQRMMEGRIKELDYVRKMINLWIAQNKIKED